MIDGSDEFALCIRFRPNIVLKGSGVPFAEDMWRQIVLQPVVPPPEGPDESRLFMLAHGVW